MGQKPELYPLSNKRQKNLPKIYHLPAFGIFILLAVLVTYPIVINLSTFFILSAAWPDEYLQSWILAWDIHAILSGYEDMLNIWNANIFYPYPTTLAYNEHLLGMSLLLMPFVLLGKTPLVAHNLGILLTNCVIRMGNLSSGLMDLRKIRGPVWLQVYCLQLLLFGCQTLLN